MQWTVQVSVLLLNIVWILFFLQPHPFSVSVQRRSTDGTKEFCIQPPSDMNWTSTVHSVNVTGAANKTNNTNTTFQDELHVFSAERGQSNLSLHESSNSTNMIKCQEHCQCNKTNMQPKHLHSSQLSEIDLRSPAPQPKPKIIFETSPSSPPHVQRQPGSSNGKGPDDCCFKFYPKRLHKNMIRSYYMTDYRCPLRGVILVTKKAHNICVDPKLSWVEDIMNSLDESNV